MSPPAGHQCHRAGLPAAPTYGLPQRAPPAHVGLLAEGPQQPAQVQSDRQQSRQDDPQSQHVEGHDPVIFRVSGRKAADLNSICIMRFTCVPIVCQ